MVEVWKDVQGYEGFYKVSSLGRVYSFSRNKFLKPDNTNGYLRVTLHRNKHRERFLVHRLVASTFIDNPLNLPQINHKDENRSNNSVDNLEWCTCLYNNNYGNRNAKISAYCRPVGRYSLDGKLIDEYKSVMEVYRKYGYDFSLLYKCCKGALNHSYGYIWKYI